MKKLLTIAIATLGVSMAAHAGFDVEPGIGATTSTTFSYKNGSTQFNYTQASYPVSLLLAYKAMDGFMIGIRGDYYLSGALTAATPTTISDTFTRTVGAAVIGYEAPRGFRIWAGYDFLNNISNTPGTNASSSDLTAINNTGAQAGIGWRFHNHIAINALYDAPSSSPTTVSNKAGSGTINSSNYNSFTDSIVQVNISFPFGGSK